MLAFWSVSWSTEGPGIPGSEPSLWSWRSLIEVKKSGVVPHNASSEDQGTTDAMVQIIWSSLLSCSIGFQRSLTSGRPSWTSGTSPASGPRYGWCHGARVPIWKDQCHAVKVRCCSLLEYSKVGLNGLVRPLPLREGLDNFCRTVPLHKCFSQWVQCELVGRR